MRSNEVILLLKVEQALAAERLERARNELEQAQAARRASEAKRAALPQGNLLVGCVYVVAFVACTIAGFLINWVVWPYVLDLAPRTLEGIAVALAPSLTPLLLGEALARVFCLDEFRDRPPRPPGPLATGAKILSSSFWVMLLTMSLGALLLIGVARREVVAILVNPQAIPGDAQLRQIGTAVLMVTVFVEVVAAVFFLLAETELRRWWRTRLAEEELLQCVMSERSKHEAWARARDVEVIAEQLLNAAHDTAELLERQSVVVRPAWQLLIELARWRLWKLATSRELDTSSGLLPTYQARDVAK